MKKQKSTTSKPTKKTRPAIKTVNQYLSRVPQPARSHLNKMRAAIRSAVPKDSVEIISYGIPPSNKNASWSGTPPFQTTAACSPPPQSSKNSKTT
jgi:hypothetical protein